MIKDAGLALDIGTTTVQAQLVDLQTGELIDFYSAFNEQRVFGQDVITRISMAQNGKLDELFYAINNQVQGILDHFINKYKLAKISKCAVSANTTMLHLFCRIDPSSMGRSPYTPVFLQERSFCGSELSLSAEKITLLPGVSAFIGADIVSGLAFVDIMNTEKKLEAPSSIFIDIGTNGEIAVWNNDEILCCSAAAGPCFEEAQINFAMNASEFIDVIAEIKRKSLIDETGTLTCEYKGITQKDVRQFQLAKSAIYSGIKMICKNSKLDAENPGAVYIAGGLGEHINLENAEYLGLLPGWANLPPAKIHICGNTSLKGAVKSLTDSGFMERCRGIIERARTMDLAGDKYFAAAFERNMWFK